jgi:hypothetical protein
MKWHDDDYNRQPGPWGGRGQNLDLQREIEEHASHYAELHPDPPTRTSLTGVVRRMAARLRGTRGRGGGPSEAAPRPEDLWAREEALYRAKNEGEPHG